MPDFEVRLITAGETLPLRHAILRAGLPRETAIFPGDEAESSRHFGAFLEGKLVGVATIHFVPLLEPAGLRSSLSIARHGDRAGSAWARRGPDAGRGLCFRRSRRGRPMDLVQCPHPLPPVFTRRMASRRRAAFSKSRPPARMCACCGRYDFAPACTVSASRDARRQAAELKPVSGTCPRNSCR